MITLSFPSRSRRWPNAGLFFNDWPDYFFTLGYLCNKDNYYYNNNGLISVHIEPNDDQGAYAEEGRIHYYGDDNLLLNYFPALYEAKSSGVGNITYRINCNEYISSLLVDYDFKIDYRGNNNIRDIIPRNNQISIVENKINTLISEDSDDGSIVFDFEALLEGYNL